jgi:membrane-associated phospholipid phosphatase
MENAMPPTTTHPFWRRWRVFAIAWLIAFAVALCIDRAVASALAPHFFAMKVNPVLRAIEYGGRTWVLLGVVALLVLVHPRRWRAAAFVFTSCLVGAVMCTVLKWAVGRTRPVADMAIDVRPFDFDFFRGGLQGLLEQRNLCFPSGHATQVFALAACLALLYPRARHAWFALALVVSLQRVVELAHYPSDVVGGALIGMLGFAAAAKLFRVDAWAIARPGSDPLAGAAPPA